MQMLLFSCSLIFWCALVSGFQEITAKSSSKTALGDDGHWEGQHSLLGFPFVGKMETAGWVFSCPHRAAGGWEAVADQGAWKDFHRMASPW